MREKNNFKTGKQLFEEVSKLLEFKTVSIIKTKIVYIKSYAILHITFDIIG